MKNRNQSKEQFIWRRLILELTGIRIEWAAIQLSMALKTPQVTLISPFTTPEITYRLNEAAAEASRLYDAL